MQGHAGCNNMMMENVVSKALEAITCTRGQLCNASSLCEYNTLCRRLPLEERATMLPWLWSVLDVNSSPEVYARYDKMTAKELFQR